MSKFHAVIRDLLEDVNVFLTRSIQNEVLSTASLTHKERLLSSLKSLQSEYPQLQLQFSDIEVKTDSKRCSTSSPVPYVDMNGGSPYKIPFFSPNDKENYDSCLPSERCDSFENRSITGSEDYASDEAKFLPEVAASELYSCEKCGYLDKKKRESSKMAERPVYPVYPEFQGQVLDAPELPTDVAATYPSAYWADNQGKPKLDLINISVQSAYRDFGQMARDRRWDDTLVATFMARVIQGNDPIFQKVGAPDWVSYERVICENGANINPLSVYEVTWANPPRGYLAADQADGGSPETRLSLFYALLTLYRKIISVGIQDQYGAMIARKINEFFKSGDFGMRDDETTMVGGYINELYMSAKYKMIISAIDMFFFKFPTLKGASMRMATFPSRYRGCDIITLLSQISTLSGMRTGELLTYVLTEHVAREVNGVLRTGEGTGDPYGYFPYHLEMGISGKSAYSLTKNPTFFLWLHAIGVVGGYKRSKNARMPLARDVARTFLTGAAVSLSLVGALGFRRYAEVAGNAPLLRGQAEAFEEARNAAAQREHDIEQGIIPADDDEDENASSDEEAQDQDPEPPGEGEQAPAQPAQPPAQQEASAAQVAPGEPPELVERGHEARSTEVMTTLLQNDGLSIAQRRLLRDLAQTCADSAPNTVGAYFYNQYGRRR